MAHKSSWTDEQVKEAEQLLKSLPPRKVAEIIGRTARQVSNKFCGYTATKLGASLAKKSKGIIIKCMQCRNDFLSRCKIKNRRCKYCKTQEDGISYGHNSLNLSASVGARGE